MSKRPKQELLPTRQNTDAYPSSVGLVEAAVVTMRNGLIDFRAVFPEEDLELDDVDTCQRGRNFANTGILAVKHGFVLEKITRAGLVDFSHRLKIPTIPNPVEYHRDAFNVDAQYIAPRQLNLVGVEEISKKPEAMVEILSFERDILYGALTNWIGYAKHSVPHVQC